MGAPRALLALAVTAAAFHQEPVPACECHWEGPFLTVEAGAPLEVVGTVVAHEGDAEWPAAMLVEVENVIRGDAGAHPLRVWGGQGWLCRPEVSAFPVGSRWVLALDGPGSKPGVEGGHALSICGTYWLALDGATAVGNLTDPTRPDATSAVALSDLVLLVQRDLPDARSAVGRAVFAAEVTEGQGFERPFGPGLRFRLAPDPWGWRIEVRVAGREEDLARLTPPLHGVPNPRELAGWHCRNADNTGSNEAGEGNVNAPGRVREFVFSPAVGVSIQGPGAAAAVSDAEVEEVARWGRGALTVEEFVLAGLERGSQARFAWLRFSVELAWGGAPAPPATLAEAGVREDR